MICSQTMAVMMANDPITKVIIYPSVEQDVFFQEQQFDEELRGTNPVHYEKGKTPSYVAPEKRAPEYGRGVMKARLKRAEAALEGHENRDEILKILRRGIE